MKMIPMIAAIAAAAMFPTVAIAQAGPTVAVSYADLDLGTEAGRRALESRIGVAVRRVCRPEPNPGLEEWADHQRCRREASAASLGQMRLAIARANGDSVPEAALAAR